jgi:murein DD-endopeptidase MepM/ murein hydrolase activator NlpD
VPRFRSRRSAGMSFVRIVSAVTTCAALVIGAAVAVPRPAGAATQSALFTGQQMTGGQELQDGPFTLVMQTDGNLVEYLAEPNGQSYALWSSGTWGNPGALVVMQTDGNLVIYLDGRPLWDSGTWGHSGVVLVVWTNGALFLADSTSLLWGVGEGPASGGMPQMLPSGNTVLHTNYGLYDGQTISAGSFLLAMQNDGNLVIYAPAGYPLWNTGTYWQPGDWLVMQGDGNLVIYDVHGNPLWAAGTWGNPGDFAVMQADANFVIYSVFGTPLWASNTAQGAYANPLRSVQSLIPERIDQGVDYSGNGPVYAMGDGVVLSLNDNGWPGTGNVTYQLTDGPGRGLDVYFAECIQPTVGVGQLVNAYTQIGVMSTSCGTGIETGWSEGDDLIPDAAAYWCFDGNDPTSYGVNFSDFLASTGAPGGIVDGPVTCPDPPPVPSYPGAPPSFPTWGASIIPSIGSAAPASPAPSVAPSPSPNGAVTVPELHGAQTQIPQSAYTFFQSVGQAIVTDQWSSVPLVGGEIAPETPGYRGYAVGSIEVVSVDNPEHPARIVAVIRIPGAADGSVEVTAELQPSGSWALASSGM